MNWSLSFFITSVLLGVGLAMDAFSVSMADGLNEPHMSQRKRFLIASAFAGFQYMMPMIGWVCVHTIVELFTGFQKLIPWIALILLCFIGGKMLIEGIKERGNEEVEHVRLRKRVLLVQAIATSIDALSVGFTIAEYGVIQALVCGLIIAVVTFILCIIGIQLGRKIGDKLSFWASIIGGVILIGIGIEIFVKGV